MVDRGRPREEDFMKPRGPLMIEHRLIEKVLKAAEQRVRSVTATGYDPVFIETIVEEHRQARSRVKSIVDLNEAFKKGDVTVVPRIVELVLWLAEFYPVHILKEDREFFPNTERYFTPAELQAMLERFREFDRNMIHEKYRAVCEEITA